MAYEYKIEKSRQFEMELYPLEDINHKNLLTFIHNNFEYIACTHDIDYFVDEETGERTLKKPHTHVIVSFANPRHYNSVRELFKMPYVMPVASYRVRVRYLIHIDDPDKAQYLPSQVFGNRAADIYTHIKGDSTPVFRKILEHIKEYTCTYMELVTWCLDEGYLEVFQKNAYIFSRLIRDPLYDNSFNKSGNGSRSE